MKKSESIKSPSRAKAEMFHSCPREGPLVAEASEDGTNVELAKCERAGKNGSDSIFFLFAFCFCGGRGSRVQRPRSIVELLIMVMKQPPSKLSVVHRVSKAFEKETLGKKMGVTAAITKSRIKM